MIHWDGGLLQKVHTKFFKNCRTTQLTHKDASFEWTELHQSAFETFKQALTKAPVLHLPDKPFVLYTDSSDSTIGAVLAQEVNGHHKPVYYLSHHLSKTQQKWPIIERECYSIVFALEKLRPYLKGMRFTIFSDHALHRFS